MVAPTAKQVDIEWIPRAYRTWAYPDVASRLKIKSIPVCGLDDQNHRVCMLPSRIFDNDGGVAHPFIIPPVGRHQHM